MNREYPPNNDVLLSKKDLSEVAFPKKILNFSQVTDISHTSGRLYKKICEKTNSLLPTGAVREGWEGFLYSGCHLKASICQQVTHTHSYFLQSSGASEAAQWHVLANTGF